MITGVSRKESSLLDTGDHFAMKNSESVTQWHAHNKPFCIEKPNSRTRPPQAFCCCSESERDVVPAAHPDGLRRVERAVEDLAHVGQHVPVGPRLEPAHVLAADVGAAAVTRLVVARPELASNLVELTVGTRKQQKSQCLNHFGATGLTGNPVKVVACH